MFLKALGLSTGPLALGVADAAFPLATAPASVSDSWQKFTLAISGSYMAITAPGGIVSDVALTTALSQQFSLSTFAAQTPFKAVLIQHSTLFSGSGITSVTCSLGTTSNPTTLTDPFAINTVPSSTNFYEDGGMRTVDFNGFTLVLQVNTVGADVNALKQGSVTVWYLNATALP